MVKKLSANFTLYDLWKLLGAVLIIFLGIIIGVKEGGEPNTMIEVDYYEETLEENEETSDEHEAARNDREKLSSICATHSDWCDKITWNGDISDYDKIGYVSQYFAIFNFLDKELVKGGDITKEFKTLIINSSGGKRRGGATWSRITINLDSFSDISQFWQVLTHEFGHIVDLGVLNGNSNTMDYNYTEFGKVKFALDDPSLEYYKYSRRSEDIRNSTALKKDFCSEYGMSNPFEDFAECHNLYLNNRRLFRTMASESSILKNKYNFFANLFDNEILWDYKTAMAYKERRPWDTTVL